MQIIEINHQVWTDPSRYFPMAEPMSASQLSYPPSRYIVANEWPVSWATLVALDLLSVGKLPDPCKSPRSTKTGLVPNRSLFLFFTTCIELSQAAQEIQAVKQLR
jgi:hypothetical protein